MFEPIDLVLQSLLFPGDVLRLKGLVPKLEELVAPFVIPGLRGLVLGAEPGYLDPAA